MQAANKRETRTKVANLSTISQSGKKARKINAQNLKREPR
jgi:hypothetical protein